MAHCVHFLDSKAVIISHGRHPLRSPSTKDQLKIILKTSKVHYYIWYRPTTQQQHYELYKIQQTWQQIT